MEDNKSDDSFYDSDQDEQMAVASTQSLYDPSLPYTPVRPNTQRSQLIHSTTLSGRQLSSSVDVKSKASQALATQVSSQMIADDPLTQPLFETPRRNRTANWEESDMGIEDNPNPKQSTSCSQLNLPFSPTSFIRASYYYEEAKEKLKHGSNEQMELDDIASMASNKENTDNGKEEMEEEGMGPATDTAERKELFDGP